MPARSVGGKTEVRPSDKGPMQFKTLEALIEESGHEAVDLLKVGWVGGWAREGAGGQEGGGLGGRASGRDLRRTHLGRGAEAGGAAWACAHTPALLSLPPAPQVDIEGYEYELVSGLRWPGSCRYPRQIAMEVHYNVSADERGRGPGAAAGA